MRQSVAHAHGRRREDDDPVEPYDEQVLRRRRADPAGPRDVVRRHRGVPRRRRAAPGRPGDVAQRRPTCRGGGCIHSDGSPPRGQGERLPRPPAGRGDAAAAGRLAGRHATRPLGRPPGLTVPRPGTVARMARAVAPPATSYAVERATLRNGLRVVLAPDRSAPVVAVAVYYDVGIRSEPEGRTGFAHLFEHLMFQGSASLGKMDHVKYVQSSGGTLNGSTRLDYTNYYEALPSNALERALFLEADRMRSPAVTEENLANQIAVVKEEIRVNVLNQPYGGFPWLTLPPLLFETFPNAHNGYGGFEDLESATVDDARDFFDRYYAPGNAVLAVGGDFDPDAGDGPGAEALRRRPAPHRPGRVPTSTSRRRRPSAATSTSTRSRRRRRSRSAGGCPTRTTSTPTCRSSSSARCSRPATRPGCAGGWCSRTGSPATSAPTSPSWRTRSTCATPPPSWSRPTTAATSRRTGSSRRSTRSSTGWRPTECPTTSWSGCAPGSARPLLQGQDHVLSRTLAMAAFEQQRGRAELVGELPGAARRRHRRAGRPPRPDAAARPAAPASTSSPGVPDEPEAQGVRAPRGARPRPAAQAAAAHGRRAGAAVRPAGGRRPAAQRAGRARPAADPVRRAPRPGPGPRRACSSARCCSAPPSAPRASWPRRCSGSAARCGSAATPTGWCSRASRCAAGSASCSACWPRC